MINVLLLEDEATWPGSVVSSLDRHHEMFLDQETGNNRPAASILNAAVYELIDLLQSCGYALRGYHCTRLTDEEIETIKAEGMTLQDGHSLRKRISKLQDTGLLTADIAERLINDNQSDDDNRARILWFCYGLNGEGDQGIERFFRSWGGEALYNSHEDDPVTGSVLNRIGTPCIIEAHVPIKSLSCKHGLSKKIIRRYLVNRGLRTVEPIDHEDCSTEPIPPENIVQVIRHPDPAFLVLSGCTQWEEVLI